MKRRNNNGTRPMISEIGIGLAAAIVISLILAIGISFPVFNGNVSESALMFVVMPIQALAAFGGAMIAGKRAKRKYAIVCGSVGAIFCFILLAMTVLFFNSTFHAIWSGIGMCLAGSAAACAMCMIGKGRRRKRK